jgi:hypothetical protein
VLGEEESQHFALVLRESRERLALLIALDVLVDEGYQLLSCHSRPRLSVSVLSSDRSRRLSVVTSSVWTFESLLDSSSV